MRRCYSKENLSAVIMMTTEYITAHSRQTGVFMWCAWIHVDRGFCSTKWQRCVLFNSLNPNGNAHNNSVPTRKFKAITIEHEKSKGGGWKAWNINFECFIRKVKCFGYPGMIFDAFLIQKQKCIHTHKKRICSLLLKQKKKSNQISLNSSVIWSWITEIFNLYV